MSQELKESLNHPLHVCGGCNAKMPPDALSRLLKSLPRSQNPDPHLLTGYENADDAAVYEVAPGLSLVQSVDFFPPFIADPEIFGRVCAVHALSDLYAMGAKPTLALSILCWPQKEDEKTLAQMLQAAASVFVEQNVSLAGGHSIHDPKPKLGFCVTGLVPTEQILYNHGAKAGDHLILTKALGVGLLSAAQVADALPKDAQEALYDELLKLNAKAAFLAHDFGVHAATDVTGFGLIGHALEMLGMSDTTSFERSIDPPSHTKESAQVNKNAEPKLRLELFIHKIPLLPYVREAIAQCFLTAGLLRNEKNYSPYLSFRHADHPLRPLLFDPQTSGGLLLAVAEDRAEKLLSQLKENGYHAADIGRFLPVASSRESLIHLL